MEVVVRNLGVSVPLKKGGTLTLLKDISFQVTSSDVVALMGPSGAGKTTLLNRLVGRGIRGEVLGDITYGGRPLAQMRTNVGYVTQDDVMYEGLTPRENLTFAAAFVDADTGPKQRAENVEMTLSKLRLDKCANTIVGSPGLVKGISGGERKRTNVAMSLLARPQLLLMDEPTSGLDAKMAEELMTDVSKIASQGCTVIATIHQPSEAVFERFMKLFLLNAGCMSYYGPVAGLRSLLQDSVGFTVSDRTPLPEVVLDILETPKVEGEVEQHTARLAELRSRSQGVDAPVAAPTGSCAEPPQPPKRMGFLGQVVNLLQRDILVVRRSKILTVVRLMQTVVSSAGIGWIFVQLDRDLEGVSARMFCAFLLVFANMLFAVLSVVNTFVAERAVFLREAHDKWYHPAAFYIAKVLVDTVMQSVFPIFVVCIAYFMIGLNTTSPARVFWFYAIMVTTMNCGAAIGFAVSASVSAVSTALAIAPGLIMPQMLLCGIFIRIPELPQPFWLFSHAMVMRYALQAVVTNEFSCDASEACDASWRKPVGKSCSDSPCDFCCTDVELVATGGVCPVVTCDEAQRFLNLQTEDLWPAGDTRDETIFYNVLAMLVVLVFLRILGLVSLIISYRKAAKAG